jgi:oligoendopeptidase F
MKERSAVAAQDKWDVERLYSGFEAWEKDFEKWARQGKRPRWPELEAFKGRLGEGSGVLAQFLKSSLEIDRALEKLHTYAHLRHDEDVAADQPKDAFGRITAAYFDFRQETSWFEPELLALPEAKLFAYLKDEQLKEYRLHLEKIIRMRPHTLSAELEDLMAKAALALQTSGKAFGSFNNADLKFPAVKDSKGESHELSHGTYQLHMRNPDRKLREETFKAMHSAFLKYENTLCDLIQGEMQKHLFEARARGYSSCLESALFPHQIDTQVYTALIDSVRRNLAPLHRYIAMRKKKMGLSELHLWDMSVSLVSDVDLSMDYERAATLVAESVLPLGTDYQTTLKKGLFEERWVDRYENARKRSGAYSSGCFDSVPYILMNFHGTYNDVTTLAHEAGHSMHSFLSNRHQPYHMSRYPIFVAEVASTFNEELLHVHLMRELKDKKQRAFLINQKIDNIRATLFRQAMFAEFELKLHTLVELGTPFTPALLKAEYRKLNEEYFGKHVVIDDEIDIEWARIPHFYYEYYVYQYATGISAAIALSQKVQKEGEAARERYLNFLSSGSSRFPVDLLRTAGVDVCTPVPVEAAIGHFDQLVSELDSLLA